MDIKATAIKIEKKSIFNKRRIFFFKENIRSACFLSSVHPRHHEVSWNEECLLVVSMAKSLPMLTLYVSLRRLYCAHCISADFEAQRGWENSYGHTVYKGHTGIKTQADQAQSRFSRPLSYTGFQLRSFTNNRPLSIGLRTNFLSEPHPHTLCGKQRKTQLGFILNSYYFIALLPAQTPMGSESVWNILLHLVLHSELSL